jgi:hypothetical protein
MQPFVRYFCANPEASISGRSLQKANKQITNASMLAKQFKQALAEVREDAESWFLIGPLRWEKDRAPARRRDGGKSLGPIKSDKSPPPAN